MKAAVCLLQLGLVIGVQGTTAQTPSEVPLSTLLSRAAVYANDYETRFSKILSDERFSQYVRDSGGRVYGRRVLDSELYFARVEDTSPWISVRNVLKVNGNRVRDSRALIEAAFEDSSGDVKSRLKTLADEGARFNLGNLRRNFSDPVLALVFLDRGHQGRFEFSLDGTSMVDGRSAYRIRYNERARPTLITGRDGLNLPVSGSLYVLPDGTLLRSELNAGVNSYATATVSVTFQADPRLAMLVPSALEERYSTEIRNRQVLIFGQASYTNYRRFETQGRIIAPKS